MLRNRSKTGSAIPQQPAATQPEAATAPQVTPQPDAPAAAEANPATDIASARASFKVDVLETLMTGRWGELEQKVADLQNHAAGFEQGIPEWPLYQAWLAEWKKAKTSETPLSQAFAPLLDAAMNALATAGGGNGVRSAPEWKGDPAADAGTWCAAMYSLRKLTVDAVENFIADHDRKSGRFKSGLMPVVNSFQKGAALPNGKPADALIAWQRTIADLEQWNPRGPAAKMPPPSSFFAEATVQIANVERGQDDFFDRLVDVIRIVDAQDKASASQLADTAFRKKIQEFGIQRVRIVNARARYKNGAREWRDSEGEAAVLKYFKMVDETFPNKN
jgi:hypothetical protein